LELEAQWLVNLGFSAAGAFGMWIINRHQRPLLQKIEDDIKEMPLRYVALRTTTATDIAEIKTMLGKTFTRN
jgi:hypothetical protein